MWIYRQVSGQIAPVGGSVLETGYSGAGEGKNNPAKQDVQKVGPIPIGAYSIGAPTDTVTHGPYVLTLSPFPANAMFGRSGFLIHGDSVVEPGTASEGCVILSRSSRTAIWNSGDHLLVVLPS
jgi:type VI secretion system (T6SS) effector TldE1-like protein